MAKYKGSVEIISGITQKNGGKFMLMDAAAVQYNDTGKSVKDVIGELKLAQEMKLFHKMKSTDYFKKGEQYYGKIS